MVSPDTMSNRISIVALVLLLAACGPSIQEQHMSDVAARRGEATSRTGSRQVLDYARSIHAAARAGAYKNAKPKLQEEVTHAAGLIDRVAATVEAQAPMDAATLVGWKALLFVDAERYKEALAEFQRSDAMHPNLMAGQNLVVIWGQANKPDQVAAVCKSTVFELATGDEQYEFISLCIENMNAISEQAALAWAAPEVVTFYQEERARRQAEAAEQQAAAERAERHERRVERQVDVCIADCKQRGYRCLNKCHGDASCEANCESSYQACLEVCDASAREALDN